MQTDVMELPLFPLNVVLFPGQTLPLHIFEPRYRIMIQRCIDNEEPFGVVLAQVDDPDEPHSVGTMARIAEVERMPDGRMNIVAVGVERFLLRDTWVSDDGYLIGNASPYPYSEDERPARGTRKSVSRMLRRYIALLAETNGVEFEFDKFPRQSVALSLFAAIALQLSLEEKQELLSLNSVAELLERESEILAEEVLFLGITARAMPEPPGVPGYSVLMN